MLVVRPVAKEDLDALLELAHLASFGLTTLPKDRDLLARRIRESLRAFDRIEDAEPHGEAYLFVLEDRARRHLAGTSGIVSKVGGFQPFYAYRVETTHHESRMLGVAKSVDVLHLVLEHDGPSEMASLFLHPDYRQGGTGRMLSLARFLFIAEFPRLFDSRVISEIRGVVDSQGRSPFWDAVGRHFFDMEFPKADYLSVVNKEFIGELMPRHPIYVPMLPREAQAVIGKPHPESLGALRILESEGFRSSGMVDIFEAGPIVQCSRDSIRAVRESIRAKVGAIVDAPLPGAPVLLSNGRADYRACQAPAARDGGGDVVLSRETARSLAIEVGAPVRTVSLRAALATPQGERCAGT
ncbi:MAG: arginine N-succinyltransferase [Candidatus Binatia bacterium]|jgi:arginine N-succinyltransferase